MRWPELHTIKLFSSIIGSDLGCLSFNDDDLVDVTAWKYCKLLSCHVVQQILLYHLPDSRVNSLWLRQVFMFLAHLDDIVVLQPSVNNVVDEKQRNR